MNDKNDLNIQNVKKFRPNVAAVVLSSKYPNKCEILIALRSDISNAWQFPQGGIDKGESSKDALFRELKEEIGTNEVDIIAEYPNYVSYEFPLAIAKKMYPYHGQKQKYYLVKLKKGAKININTDNPEFCDYKFVCVKNIYDYVTFFKRNVYKEVIQYFKIEGYI